MLGHPGSLGAHFGAPPSPKEKENVVTAEVEIDVEVLKSEIKRTYASVSQAPEKDFIFPTGPP